MRLLRRASRRDGDPDLDRRLHQVFDDKRTPGAPETLYSCLREVSMDSPTEQGRSRLWFLGGLRGRARTAAALTAVLIVIAGAVVVTTVIPRTGGVGSGPTAAASIPPTPTAPAGWHFVDAFGTVGSSVGVNLPLPAQRIAIHVVCNGFDELVVLASTEASDTPANRPLQAALFYCSGEGRVVLTAATGQFQGVRAFLVPGPGSTISSSYVVSIEVPDEMPTPLPSALR
jgi:hypothetical protein